MTIHEDVIAFVRIGCAGIGDTVHTTDNRAYLVTPAIYKAVMRPVDVRREQLLLVRWVITRGMAA